MNVWKNLCETITEVTMGLGESEGIVLTKEDWSKFFLDDDDSLLWSRVITSSPTTTPVNISCNIFLKK